MPGIKIHDDESPLKGAVMYLNKSVITYLEKNEDRIHENKFKHLKEMMEQDLYLTDVRFAGTGEKYNQVDLVGFKNDGQPVCFTMRTNEKLEVSQFIEPSLVNMSDATQEMAQEIHNELFGEPEVTKSGAPK